MLPRAGPIFVILKEVSQDVTATTVGQEKSQALYLVFCVPSQPPFSIPMPTVGAATVGRHLPVEVFLDHPSVSRRHARIVAGSPPLLEDLGSRNGTKVGGRRLLDGQTSPVRGGDVLQFGDVSCFVQHQAHTRLEITEATPVLRAPGTVVASPALAEVYELLEVIAPTALPVLILGETGVGKDVFAKNVHATSARASKPFTRLNCAALPETLLEAELFGYERGAFTGAVSSKPGLFEATNGGTIFLDEVGEIPLATQAKLLVVLESGETTRLGSLKPIVVDVRVVSATNRDLAVRVQEGKFRADLYFRLNGISVTIPPLRDRLSEVEPLAKHMLTEAAKKLGAAQVLLDPAALSKLKAYDFPGNIRELKNVLERAAALARGGPILPSHILLDRLGNQLLVRAPVPPAVSPSSQTLPPVVPSEPIDEEGLLKRKVIETEREEILQALEACGFNQSRTAKQLGISRATLVRRIVEYGIPRPRK
jgi:transcriptional regulator with GAF, ATPase, and Fis domain